MSSHGIRALFGEYKKASDEVSKYNENINKVYAVRAQVEQYPFIVKKQHHMFCCYLSIIPEENYDDAVKETKDLFGEYHDAIRAVTHQWLLHADSLLTKVSSGVSKLAEVRHRCTRIREILEHVPENVSEPRTMNDIRWKEKECVPQQWTCDLLDIEELVDTFESYESQLDVLRNQKQHYVEWSDQLGHHGKELPEFIMDHIADIDCQIERIQAVLNEVTSVLEEV